MLWNRSLARKRRRRLKKHTPGFRIAVIGTILWTVRCGGASRFTARAGDDRADSCKMPGRRASSSSARVRLFLSNQESVVSEVIEFKSWVCLICGWIYNEEEGLPDEGIPAGTRFDDIPADWRCPLCDVGKADFVVVEF